MVRTTGTIVKNKGNGRYVVDFDVVDFDPGESVVAEVRDKGVTPVYANQVWNFPDHAAVRVQIDALGMWRVFDINTGRERPLVGRKGANHEAIEQILNERAEYQRG